jgi:YVTN family beta-propeller protein
MSQKNIFSQYLKNSSQKKKRFSIHYFPVIFHALLFVICSSLIFVACESVQEYVKSQETASGQVSIFLKGPDETSMDVSFDLLALNIIAEDGSSREIMSIPRKINSVALTGQQILLCEETLPTDRYKKLQLVVQEALIKREDWTANLALPDEGIFVNIDFVLSRDQNVSIFLSWDVEASVVDQYLFKPLFTVKRQVPELSSLLIYVSNEDSNNVSVINRQTGEIVATVMVGKKPRGLAVSLSRERPRVYVANAGSNSISVIEPTQNKVEQEIPMK